MRHVDNDILKDTLRLKILWTWIKIRANSFIKTLVNIMKRKSTKVPCKLSLGKKMRPRTSKNISPKFIAPDISIAVIRLFKSNPVFIAILDSFCHSLLTFLPFDFYLYFTDFEVHPVPLRL